MYPCAQSGAWIFRFDYWSHHTVFSTQLFELLLWTLLILRRKQAGLDTDLICFSGRLRSYCQEPHLDQDSKTRLVSHAWLWHSGNVHRLVDHEGLNRLYLHYRLCEYENAFAADVNWLVQCQMSVARKIWFKSPLGNWKRIRNAYCKRAWIASALFEI